MTEPLHIYVAMKTFRSHVVRACRARFGFVVRAVVTTSVLWACQPLVAQVVTPFQPDVRWGGRTVSVSVNPSNTAEAIAGTERGGLFKTRDGGTTWRHIDRLTMSRIHDVRYAPASPDGTNVVIVTGPDDTRVTNRGGIWHSMDGGETWIKPGSSNPPCLARASAHGIAFQPGSPNVYVGTDCGLAISRDFGVTWRHFRSPSDDPGATPIGRVLSVAARAGGLVDIGVDGLIDNNGDGWVDANTGAIRRGHIRFTYDGRSFAIVARQMDFPDSFNSVTASPVEPSVVYVATGSGLTELHGPIRPGIGGMLTRFDVTPDGCCRTGRQNWVAATPSRDGRRDHVDVYFSDGYQTWRRTCETTGEAPRCRRGGWDRLGVDHEDHNGIAFDPLTNLPRFLAGDGGLHGPTDAADPRATGGNWRIVGAGNGGFNALMIYQVAGQLIGNAAAPSRIDLLFGTQDNHLFASPDHNSRRWPVEIGNEGYRIQLGRNSPRDDGKVTWTQPGFLSDPCCNYIGDRRFNNGDWPVGSIPPVGFNGWASPSGRIIDTPTFVAPRIYVQAAEPGVRVHVTRDDGASWRLLGAVAWRVQRYPYPQVARSGDDVTVYQPVVRIDNTIGLVKITGLRMDGTVDASRTGWRLADGFLSGDIMGLGVRDDEFDWQVAYAVDPNDSAHLIAADARAGAMKVSRDGGFTWTTDATLTALSMGSDPLTGLSEFLFATQGNRTQVRVIAFDPDHPGHILVGTEAAGIFRSVDGGLSWGSIPGTRQIPSVSSFFFIPESPTNPNAEVVVSSYGRGLWKLSIPPGTEVRPYNISPIIPAWGNWVRHSLTGASEAKNMMQPGGCLACRWMIAVGGGLNDLRLDAKQQVTALALDKGARLVGSTWDGRPLTVDQALLTAVPPDGGKDKFIGCQDLVKRGGAVRGLILEGTTVRAIIGGEGKLPNEDIVAKFVPPAVTPRDAPLAPQPSGPVLIATGTVPGTNVAFVGASVPIGGSGFCPSARCGKLEIRVGERVAALVEVNAKGEFDASIVLAANDGGDRRITPNTLTATQKDPSGKLITTRTMLLVALSSDEPPKRQ